MHSIKGTVANKGLCHDKYVKLQDTLTRLVYDRYNFEGFTQALQH